MLAVKSQTLTTSIGMLLVSVHPLAAVAVRVAVYVPAGTGAPEASFPSHEMDEDVPVPVNVRPPTVIVHVGGVPDGSVIDPVKR